MHTFEELQQGAIDAVDSRIYSKEPSILYEPIDYSLRQGGKRIRPLLTLIAAEMFGADMERAKPAAVAVEMLHNFTLLHDDIMDNSPLRRGKPTVFKKYGTNSAILSGDTMFAKAFTYLYECDKDKISELVEIMLQGSIEVCEGQAYDMEFETRDDVTIEQYLEMIRLKTGVLLSTALSLGAVVAGCGRDDLEKLKIFGQNIGIAFQIQDDIFDCWSDLEEFGKVTGTDIADNKKTFLYLKALEVAGEEQRKELLRLFSLRSFDRKEKEDSVKAIYESLEIRSYAKQLMNKHYETALKALEEIDVVKSRKDNLYLFAKKLITRNK